jgi:hypothetical protein
MPKWQKKGTLKTKKGVKVLRRLLISIVLYGKTEFWGPKGGDRGTGPKGLGDECVAKGYDIKVVPDENDRKKNALDQNPRRIASILAAVT